MNEDKDIDAVANKQEDAVIQSLEEITDTIVHLKNLKTELENLISHYSIKKS
jgi:tetrahydromethanopterin S-methyltransferase subunit B